MIHLCSIPELLHRYIDCYFSEIIAKNYDIKEAIAFLRMVCRKERKLEWAFKQKEKGEKNKDLASVCGVGIRWFQKLYVEYKMSGKVPQLNWNRRPKKVLTEEERELVNKAIDKSKRTGAVYLGLFIKKYYGKNLSHNKIHEYLLENGLAREDEKKKRQRVYILYERTHSFSLVHLDWHDSDCIPGKKVCSIIDDASRKILCGDEFDRELEEYTIGLMNKAIEIAFKDYSSVIFSCNTDRGPQFYNNTKNRDGERNKNEFEKFLEKNNIKHIPSRRSHPQTNGKQERWFRTYEENRMKFKTFEEFVDWYNNSIHLGLSRKEGITPNEATLFKLRSEALLGLFFRRIDRN